MCGLLSQGEIKDTGFRGAHHTPTLLHGHIVLKTLEYKAVCPIGLAVHEVGVDQRDPIECSVRLAARGHQVQEPLTKLSIPRVYVG